MPRFEHKLMCNKLVVRNEHRLVSVIAARNKHRVASAVSAGPAVAHGGDAVTPGAGTATPGETRSGVTPPRAGITPTAAAPTTGPTSLPAHGLGGSAISGVADRDPEGEPRSDAAADITALLEPNRGEEPRCGTRPAVLESQI